jgi:hypothetical protein
MKTLTVPTASKLVLLAFALAAPAMNPTSARSDDRRKDEAGDRTDDRTDEKSDPVPPIVCDDDGDKKTQRTGSGEADRRRSPPPHDPGRCVDPAPPE